MPDQCVNLGVLHAAGDGAFRLRMAT
jgi:hypothetical protein